ncbi:hypothetical protein HMSSN036_85500 [Paenibacillus macerans]|nr:hypothetical protein HMSSN036_85500 [Paenibacillus macerans]
MSGKDVLQADHLAYSFENKQKPLFQNVSFSLQRGETVALIGPNGIGKSTLLKMLTGDLKPASGKITWGAKVKSAFTIRSRPT